MRDIKDREKKKRCLLLSFAKTRILQTLSHLIEKFDEVETRLSKTHEYDTVEKERIGKMTGGNDVFIRRSSSSFLSVIFNIISLRY